MKGKKSHRQRQTRTMTTIDGDTGEGKIEPQCGCWHSAPPPLYEAERSSVSTSNRWKAPTFFILPSALTHMQTSYFTLPRAREMHSSSMHTWSRWLAETGLTPQWPPWQPRSTWTGWMAVNLISARLISTWENEHEHVLHLFTETNHVCTWRFSKKRKKHTCALTQNGTHVNLQRHMMHMNDLNLHVWVLVNSAAETVAQIH